MTVMQLIIAIELALIVAALCDIRDEIKNVNSKTTTENRKTP